MSAVRLRLGLIAVAALYCNAAATAATSIPVTPSAPVLRAADPTTHDDGTAPKADSASPGAAAATPGASAATPGTPADKSAPLEVQPPPQPQRPPQPPNLTIPAPPVTPAQPGTEPAPPPGETLKQHQEPGPGGQDLDKPPRGEGAAMIPKETPSGVKAIETWIWSWFE